MPVTPFHFGPGLLLKAAAPRHFSLLAFIGANVAIDLESAYFLFTGGFPVHRTLHTLPVATAAGLAIGVLVHLIWNRRRDLAASAKAQFWSAAVGGVLGGLTHALLDGVMHADIRPFLPFTDANPLLRATSLGTLHLVCLATGAIGITVLAGRHLRDNR